jgi:hypothetical protein
MSSNDLPFFPNTVAKNIDGEVTVYTEAGITLRDYFAAKAMQSIIAINGRNISLQASAGHAYEAADAMLKAGKGKGGE